MNTLIHFKRWACGIADDAVTVANAKLHAQKLLNARAEAAKKTASKRTLSTDPKAVAKREAMRKWRAKG